MRRNLTVRVTYVQHECIIICCCRSDGTIDVWASGSHAVVSRTADHTVLSSNPPLPTGHTVRNSTQSSSTDLQSKTHNTVWVNSLVQCRFTSTETVPTIKDGAGSPGRPPRLSHSSGTLGQQLSASYKLSDVQSSARRAQELCENRGGRPGLPVPSSPYHLCGRKATLNEPKCFRTQELCESRGGCPGLPVPNSPYHLCGRKTTSNAPQRAGLV